MALYTKAIEIEPQNAVFFANRAFAHIKLEEYGSAVVDATKAIEADPSYAKVRQQQQPSSCRPLPQSRACLLLFQWHVDKLHASVLTAAAACRDPGPGRHKQHCLPHMQGYYRRGDANFMLGKFKEAQKDFKTVRAVIPACPAEPHPACLQARPLPRAAACGTCTRAIHVQHHSCADAQRACRRLVLRPKTRTCAKSLQSAKSQCGVSSLRRRLPHRYGLTSPFFVSFDDACLSTSCQADAFSVSWGW